MSNLAVWGGIATVVVASTLGDVLQSRAMKEIGDLGLVRKSEGPWAVIRRGEPLNARGLAQRLGKYGIAPSYQRIGDEMARGYTRAQFADTWSRYLGTPPNESATSATPANDNDDEPLF